MEECRTANLPDSFGTTGGRVHGATLVGGRPTRTGSGSLGGDLVKERDCRWLRASTRETVSSAQAVGPIGDGNGEMGEHDSGVMGVPRDAAVVQGLRHRLCQTGAIGQLTEQCRASMRDEVPAIG
jgi:hypothetical protein